MRPVDRAEPYLMRLRLMHFTPTFKGSGPKGSNETLIGQKPITRRRNIVVQVPVASPDSRYGEFIGPGMLSAQEKGERYKGAPRGPYFIAEENRSGSGGS